MPAGAVGRPSTKRWCGRIRCRGQLTTSCRSKTAATIGGGFCRRTGSATWPATVSSHRRQCATVVVGDWALIVRWVFPDVRVVQLVMMHAHHLLALPVCGGRCAQRALVTRRRCQRCEHQRGEQYCEFHIKDTMPAKDLFDVSPRGRGSNPADSLAGHPWHCCKICPRGVNLSCPQPVYDAASYSIPRIQTSPHLTAPPAHVGSGGTSLSMY